MKAIYNNSKKVPSLLLFAFFVASIFLPNTAFAHQPRIASGTPITVPDPEISKAYYGRLTGAPVVYKITAKSPFPLYVNVLAPDIAGQKKDISALITKDGEEVANLDGTTFTWTQFFEEFGHDNYLKGPEYKAQVGAGNYEIIVSSTNNDSAYSLAVGEAEVFDFKESLNSYALIPKIKKDFFNESPATFALSPLGYGLIISMTFLGFLFGITYRFILRRISKNTVRTNAKNIGVGDRLVRFALAIALYVWAISTSWSFILLFLAGFTLFEAIFSWCGFYAALGKSTCPIN